MGVRKNALLYSCAIALAASATLQGAEDNEDALLTRAQQTFKPLPADAGTPDRPLTPERVALGRALFFETRVSSGGNRADVEEQAVKALVSPLAYGNADGSIGLGPINFASTAEPGLPGTRSARRRPKVKSAEGCSFTVRCETFSA